MTTQPVKEFGQCSVCHWGHSEREYREQFGLNPPPEEFRNRVRIDSELYCPDCRRWKEARVDSAAAGDGDGGAR